MRFYNQQHSFYCGVDLHARTMYLCILDRDGQIVFHHNLAARPDAFLHAIKPFREDLAVCAECMFTWYWLADLCQQEQIAFVLGHALYMKAIHGGKSKNDQIDSEKIARLLRGGNLPMAYVYPKGMRETRDLLRRRTYLVRKRAETIAHVQNTNSQYNLSPFGKKLDRKSNRDQLDVPQRFESPSVQKSMEADVALMDHLDVQIRRLQEYLHKNVKVDDPQTYHRLRSIPGVGRVLGLVLLYEIHDIGRFESVGNFLSYARLVRPQHESAGKKKAGGGKKIGNPHLKWAFSEAILLLLRESERAKKWKQRQEKKHGKGRALSLLAAKLGRCVYWMLRKKELFDEDRFWTN